MANNNKKISFSIIILFLIISSVKQKEVLLEESNLKEKPKLLFIWEHFRHGARDPYTQVNLTTWIDFIGVQWKSQGELNSIGLRSHYLLGVATRKKYNNFLSSSYDPNEIFIISTDVNRTIMSAMANLQGIYNNYTTPNLSDSQISNSKINNLNETYKGKISEKIKELKNRYIQDGISVVPIHLFSRYGLQFKLNDDDYCPGIKKFKDEAKNQEKVKSMRNDFYQYTNYTYGKYIFQFMNVSMEKDPDYIFEDSNFYYICDSYIADYISGRDMPHIKNTGINMEEFYYHCLNHSAFDTYYLNYGLPPTKACYVAVSPMFRTIFNYMDRRIYINEHSDSNKLDPSSPKYVIYSGHDSTVGAVDVFLNAEFNIPYGNPEYTTSQYFELWEVNKKYYVKYLLNQEVKAIYDYEYFRKKTTDKLFSQDEVEKICNEEIPIEEKEDNKYKTPFFIVLSIAIVCFFVLITLLILEKRRKKL